MPSPQHPWIEHGYRVFALEGPGGLKIERLARHVGKNKSSFYHHFADLEIFTSELLAYHLDQAKLMAEKESASTTQAQLIDVIVEHGTDLLFNRQLRIHREHPEFEACFTETNRLTVHAVLGIWAEMLGLGDNSYLAGLVLRLSLENFYLQLTPDTLNANWLNQYFAELTTMVRAFKQTGSLSTLDGSV